MRHTAVWVTKDLLNNMVSFFPLQNFKAWWNNFVTFLRAVDLQRCMSSKRNTTPDFRLGTGLLRYPSTSPTVCFPNQFFSQHLLLFLFTHKLGLLFLLFRHFVESFIKFSQVYVRFLPISTVLKTVNMRLAAKQQTQITIKSQIITNESSQYVT